MRIERGMRRTLLLAGLSVATGGALAQSAGGLPLMVAQGAGGTSYSVPIQTLLFFTALSFLPAVLLLMTGFTRIVIVLSLLRQALGTQAAPPNQVIIGLSLFLTFFVMGPTLQQVYDRAYQPFAANQIEFSEALQRGEVPLREFMLKQTREADLALFVELARLPRPSTPSDLPMRVVIPAYAISELKTGFQMGFFLFIPFLLIDLIVSTTLLSMGMLQLPPAMISLPFKILLFVMIDGWNLIVGSIVRSFH